jgi:uncharacterized repeat protein (TIGR03803 family)
MWPFTLRNTRTTSVSSRRRHTFRPILEALEDRALPSAATPLITWPAPAPISYGAPLSSAQLDATAVDPTTGAPVSGSFVYTPGAGTVLPGGTTILTAVFTPTDTTDYATATGSATLVVTPGDYISTLATGARAHNSGLVEDSLGNFYGTTYNGGANNYGSIFELANGSNSLTTLASFNSSTGIFPEGGLVMDSSGNLYGTTSGSAGGNGAGGVFELAKGSSTITNRGLFTGANGSYPEAGLVLDSSGNLYGTTVSGGANNFGTVFEVLNGRNAITVLASFNRTNGADPEAGLILDDSGNLYGTTYAGGAHNLGTVFEIFKGTGAITTLASFNGADGAEPEAGLARDASGNLYGTTFRGGPLSLGNVFELPAGGAITTLASFNRYNGSGPEAGLILDGSGNLYGTTYSGGASNYGTVFEVGAGSGAITTLATFDGGNGIAPEAGLILDGSGNLYGTTASGLGTVFEVNRFAAGQPPLVVNPASAGSSVVSAAATSLRVLGNDYYGDTSLTYTWAVASVPAGAATPTLTFAAGVSNGTNAARTAAANFYAAGPYTFQVTITDPAGLSTVSSASVTVVQSPSSIGISPANPTLAVKSRQQFQATVLDQFGQPMATQPTAYTWSIVSGVGSISSSGVYSSGKAGSATVQVTANADFYSGFSGTISGTTTVTVIALPAAPSNLTASATLVAGVPQVQLHWTDHSTNQTGVMVQRSSDGGATWTTITVVSGGASTWTDSTVSLDAAYEYRVVAYDALGDSPFSNVVKVTTPV